jgi:hypothetical protein
MKDPSQKLSEIIFTGSEGGDERLVSLSFSSSSSSSLYLL